MVPEQVNIPVKMMLERGLAERYNISLTIQMVPEGTGKMLDMLAKKETDIALTVADAFMVACSKFHMQRQVAYKNIRIQFEYHYNILLLICVHHDV